VIERTWLLLYLLKLVDSAKHAELGRAAATSLVTTRCVRALRSERIVIFAVEPTHDLIGRRRVWRTQSVGESIESEIIAKHVQSG
jgi:hypothetical protein